MLHHTHLLVTSHTPARYITPKLLVTSHQTACYITHTCLLQNKKDKGAERDEESQQAEEERAPPPRSSPIFQFELYDNVYARVTPLRADIAQIYNRIVSCENEPRYDIYFPADSCVCNNLAEQHLQRSPYPVRRNDYVGREVYIPAGGGVKGGRYRINALGGMALDNTFVCEPVDVDSDGLDSDGDGRTVAISMDVGRVIRAIADEKRKKRRQQVERQKKASNFPHTYTQAPPPPPCWPVTVHTRPPPMQALREKLQLIKKAEDAKKVRSVFLTPPPFLLSKNCYRIFGLY